MASAWKKYSAASLAAALMLLAATSSSAKGIPEKYIPPSVLLELRVVENQFKAALGRDCAPDRCSVKGCVYQDHVTLDQRRESSLPGLPAEEGPGGVVAQEYLTQVLCEFTHERSVSKRVVGKLVRRLEKRLSRGWLAVTVAPEALEAIPRSLAEPLPEPEEPQKTVEEPAEELPVEPEELTSELALRQLWAALFPHSPWMTAVLLLTLCALVLIWALRRLGKPRFDEKLLEAQLQNGLLAEKTAEPETPVEVEAPAETDLDDKYAEEQEQLWNDRINRISNEEDDDDVISRLLREWLKAGDYPTLARALLVFGDKASQSFESAPELALKKVEFAAYFRDVDQVALPSRAKFFRDLNQQAMASLLLSQQDVQLYRSLREDFGASGFVGLMGELPPRFASLLFALADYSQQLEVTPLLTAELRNKVAGQLLYSTRISMGESSYLGKCVEAVRVGAELPQAHTAVATREHGLVIESAMALSSLLPHIDSTDRQALFAAALERHGGALPHWYEDIVFSHMLTALPDEVRNDLLLEVDVRGLAAWLQTQQPGWRQAFTGTLSRPLQNALVANIVTGSRSERIRLARRGHSGIVAALKIAYERKGVRFVDLVG